MLSVSCSDEIVITVLGFNSGSKTGLGPSSGPDSGPGSGSTTGSVAGSSPGCTEIGGDKVEVFRGSCSSDVSSRDCACACASTCVCKSVHDIGAEGDCDDGIVMLNSR